ncbi:SICAvar, type I (fragment) [Plasmodium knowlesi strain H]|uniref:SICAvar, type I n=2 Tax=Plasmodium knowlesi (strain H) TaxID=5851 RepID=A0A1A7W6G8_PLAKH
MSGRGGGSNSGGLLQDWLEKHAQVGTAGRSAEEVAKEITAELKKDLEEAWSKLQAALTQGEPKEMTDLCSEGVSWEGKKLGYRQQYKQDLCKGVVELRYFTAGGGTVRNRKLEFETSIEPEEWYPRCVVGALALGELYGDHCQLEEVISEISPKVEMKLAQNKAAARNLGKCEDIAHTDIMLAKALLHDQIKKWTKTKRDAKKQGGWRIGNLWDDRWMRVCPVGGKGAKEEQIAEARRKAKQENAESLTTLVEVGTAPTSTQPGEPSMADILSKDDLTLEVTAVEKAFEAVTKGGTVDPTKLTQAMEKIKEASKEKTADVCIKSKKSGDQEKNMCERLQCIVDYLKERDKATASGSPKPTIDFWEKDNGAVKALWDDLAKAMTTEGTKENGNVDCKGLDKPSDRAACNFLHAGLNYLYSTDTTATSLASSTTSVVDVLKNNPSFRQTMGCFLLHAYAKHMKEKATCLIDDGIKKAFDSWQNPENQTGTSCNGTDKNCIPCKWEQDNYDQCKINTNGGAPATGEPVENKLKGIIEEDKENHVKTMAKKINEVTALCDQVKCVTARWRKHNTNGGSDRTWEEVWKEVGKEIPNVGEALKKATSDGNKNEFEQYCNGLKRVNGVEQGKEACLLIAAGLKNLYDIQDNADHVNASFQRTMQCVLLNAIANKLERLPCKEERSVTEGIKKAFENSEKIKGENNCSSDKCFKCDRFKTLSTCYVNSNSDPVKTKVDEKLENEDTFKEKSLETKICKPCTGSGTLCDQFKCVAKKWGALRGHSDIPPWDKMSGDIGGVLNTLLTNMRDKQSEVATYCSAWDDDAPGKANKAACLLVAAGLQRISYFQHEYKPYRTNGDYNPYDNQEYKQLVSCLLLKAVAHRMKEESKICNIEEGIKAAFSKADEIKKEKCINGKPCIVCTWDENTQDWLKDCNINNGKGPTVNVKTKLNKLLTQEKNKPHVDSTLSAITKEEGNKGPTLCPRLQCLASRVQALQTQGQACLSAKVESLAQQAQGSAQSNAQSFWEKNGEVDKLWNELAGEMNTRGTEEQSECNTVDTGRKPTDPEKRACNHLTLGFNKLKQDPPSNGNNYTILKKDNPLLRQTVGCFLLKEYAKKMQKGSKCVITSGLKKAFDSWNGSINGQCTNNTSCIKCEWKDNEYDSCDVKITTNGNQTETAKNKIGTLLDDKKAERNAAMDKINETKSLCAKLKCAAPKWFENQNKLANGKGGSVSTPAKTWCNFWDGAVKDALKEMFEKIEKNGQNSTTNNNAACRAFGDGNPLSVERKACNHIAAGLRYINKIGGTDSGGAQTSNANAMNFDKFFKQTMMCAALNLYADKIRDESQKKCPIDETRIKEMFSYGNAINNSTSSSTSCKSGVYGCFECKRNDKILEGCELSVASSLISTTSPSSPNGQNCTSSDDNKKVQEKMTNLLKEDPIRMNETLSTINKMDSFCSKMQCAAKQYHKSNNKNGRPLSWETLSTITEMDSFCSKMQCAAKQYAKMQNGGQPKTTLSWEEINDVVKEELTKLIGHITNEDKWKDVAALCGNVSSSTSNDTPGEEKAKQKACKLFASGLKHISEIKDDTNKDVVPLRKTMMCAALNLYADQLINKSTDQCPLDNKKLEEAIKYAFEEGNATIKKGKSSCTTQGNNSCFVCNRQDKNDFANCQIGSNSTDKVGKKMTELLLEQDKTNSKTKSNTPNMTKTLEEINKIESFCTQVQCAIKQHYRKTPNAKALPNGTPSWDDILSDAKDELSKLLQQMTEGQTKGNLAKYCNDKDAKWNTLRTKEKQTNRAACLLFASGLQHIYKQKKGQFNGPSFGQTMGCLFLKEYAKQLKEMALKQKDYKVHPRCSVDGGIDHAFEKSGNIMNASSQCKNNVPNSCFECKLKEGYDDCKIGSDSVKTKVKPMLKDDIANKEHMEKTLENTLCPILPMDFLTPFLPLAPVSIGLSAMAYYLWKYFGPLGKGGPRFRRSPAEIPGPSVQEQVLDHVQQDSSHEYQLVKERKPPSVPARTKRSGRVNRRTIIEIHFEVLDECQKGDTQLNQKDFLELLVQEFMGSELMEEEQVPKEEVLMEGVPMESIPLEQVPMERVPSLGSGFMV